MLILSTTKRADTNNLIIYAFVTLLITLFVGHPIVRASEDTGEQGASGGPLWLAIGSDNEPQEANISPQLEALLKRIGPNMRASADYRDYQDVNLNHSLEAWRLMHDKTKRVAERQVRMYAPKLKEFLKDSNVSIQCASATSRMMAAIGALDSWAIQMWSYSGTFPPGGLLDGQFTELGHYRGCVDLESAHATTLAQTRRHPASYCVVGFRPIVPVRKRFHLIFREEARELLELFNSSNVFASLAYRAQYFHYVYMKTGLCVPSECSVADIQQAVALAARRLTLMAAPVKCFTRALGKQEQQQQADLKNLENSKPVLVNLNQRMNTIQLVAATLIGGFFSLVALVTIWHGLELAGQILNTPAKWPDEFDANNNNNNNNHLTVVDIKSKEELLTRGAPPPQQASTLKNAAFYYLSMITNGREFMDTSMRPGDIKCLHVFRVFSMIWIICVHTLQYNEWSGFTRIFENVPSFQNILVHPLINANYVVDNFFLMSGLLASYTCWRSNTASNFSVARSLLGRYLRLTPQVLLVSLMYIVLPLMGQNGPFWYDMTHYSAKYCEKNWWVNLLHAQAFYSKDEMCNLVSWWISVDMLYYLLSLPLLWLILNQRVRLAFAFTSAYVIYSTVATAWRHYLAGFSPNNLGLVPQVQEVWREFVVDWFWSPAPHAFVFFFGFWLGFVLANKLGIHQVRQWSRCGWLLSLATLITINMSSRLWTTGVLELTPANQYISTGYNIVCVIGWACSFGWMIVACHYGCAPVIDRLSSTNTCVMLSKASFIIYLSHMLILRMHFGSQYNLLEVSIGSISMLMIGLVVFSILFGVFLCVAFEGPCLKFQRAMLRSIGRTERKPTLAGSSYHLEMNGSHQYGHNTTIADDEQKEAFNLNPTSVTLLK